ncbi:hypothetical protein ACQDBC_001398 [Proteus mirabilis]|uniref:putative phage abortive infection protein n=1 Tax=Proteus mirabilis TaxID=584 RepID=UPI0015837E6B|nr:hypothetical protein [Proteus mirabilis]MBI6369743.1 hypothetical protein [Proteus mirabilis]MCU6313940.1 putative phage abortive infection protein [Proteus mirabilis]HCZ8574972.1 hypothetical protein [Proteus mirabilis]HEK0402540.1 hypothetical protein [Proteus mirabilis]HEK1812223.1 hypothetical protein [Proteus mirabilis]
MNLKLCTNIFLTVLVILAVSALIVCWNDITVKEVWSNYISKPDPWVGIFTSIGAIFTVFVFIVTAYASLKSGESAKIAAKALELSRESSRRDDFIKQFTLLLEQHNRSHDALAKSIDSNNGQLISNSSSFIQWGMTLKEASKKLFQHYQYSPYMRILYRNLKYINESFYLESDDNKYIEEKKQYTAILRSIIRNDILFFVAINAKNEMKIFRRYEEMLKNFSFFEHIIIDDIGTKIKFNIEEKKNVFSLNVKKLFEFYLNDYLNKTVYVRTTLEDKSIINEGVVLESSFVYEVMRDFSLWQYNLFKEDLLRIIECYYSYLKNLQNKYFTLNDSYYLYKGEKTGWINNSKDENLILKDEIILNDGFSISLVDELEDILEGKINCNNKVINLNKDIFFKKEGDINYQSFEYIKKQCIKINLKKEELNNYFETYDDMYLNILNYVIKEVNETELFKKMNEKLKIDSTGTILFEK